MDNRDEALRQLQETFRHEREEQELAATKEPMIGTASAPRRQLPLPRGRILAWLIALVVVVAIGTPLVIVGASLLQRFNIADSVRTFCGDLTDQNYPAAYGLLSHRAALSVSEAQFADEVQSAHLASCTINEGGARYDIYGSKAGVTVTLIYADASGNSTSVDSAIVLVNENGGWRVDSVGDIDLGASQ